MEPAEVRRGQSGWCCRAGEEAVLGPGVCWARAAQLHDVAPDQAPCWSARLSSATHVSLYLQGEGEAYGARPTGCDPTDQQSLHPLPCRAWTRRTMLRWRPLHRQSRGSRTFCRRVPDRILQLGWTAQTSILACIQPCMRGRRKALQNLASQTAPPAPSVPGGSAGGAACGGRGRQGAVCEREQGEPHPGGARSKLLFHGGLLEISGFRVCKHEQGGPCADSAQARH